ncbi:DUF692 domain-containing protein [Paraliomyxa miuraensis]|uniref:DUF692 domain-containing protein n=1 Tax=Paraliomyxa miuraensis TaxID=376150 RepID=UPI00225144ED|nr:DUF692 domain-containing protein [Paraliomyxa miuraensis]MCX4244993.1 DUF692 domain-containing protein [Paraliomyxa miuraensis]
MTTTQPTGVGIGLRREHFAAIEQCERRVGWLEIIPENYVAHGGHALANLRWCAERWPVVAHGVSLSVGGPDPLDEDYLVGLRRLLDELRAPFYTDHLCYATIGGVNFYDLLPLPFSEEAVHHTAARIRQLADRLERPVAVENISYYATMPGGTMSEGQFVSAVVEEADCGLLLDVNNVYVNAQNHREDPRASLAALPLHRTMQIHIAGHVKEGERIIDNHGRPLIEPVWALYEQALQAVGPVPTLLEWDTDIPALDRVLDEADRAQAIWERVASSWSPSHAPRTARSA